MPGKEIFSLNASAGHIILLALFCSFYCCHDSFCCPKSRKQLKVLTRTLNLTTRNRKKHIRNADGLRHICCIDLNAT